MCFFDTCISSYAVSSCSFYLFSNWIIFWEFLYILDTSCWWYANMFFSVACVFLLNMVFHKVKNSLMKYNFLISPFMDHPLISSLKTLCLALILEGFKIFFSSKFCLVLFFHMNVQFPVALGPLLKRLHWIVLELCPKSIGPNYVSGFMGSESAPLGMCLSVNFFLLFW